MGKKKWTKREMRIVYFITKFGFSGIDFLGEVRGIYGITNILNTSPKGLAYQIAGFRSLLGLTRDPELYVERTSKAQQEIVREFDNKTVSQVRKSLEFDNNEFNEGSRETDTSGAESIDSPVEERKQGLNGQYWIDFDGL